MPTSGDTTHPGPAAPLSSVPPSTVSSVSGSSRSLLNASRTFAFTPLPASALLSEGTLDGVDEEADKLIGIDRCVDKSILPDVRDAMVDLLALQKEEKLLCKRLSDCRQRLYSWVRGCSGAVEGGAGNKQDVQQGMKFLTLDQGLLPPIENTRVTALYTRGDPGRDEAPQDLDAVSLNDQRALPVSDAVAPALDEALPSASKRPRRNRRLPKRYRDILPEPASALPPQISQRIPPVEQPSQDVDSAGPGGFSAATQSVGNRILTFLRSPLNAFGLSRTYYATSFPDHDPEDSFSLHDLSSSCFEPSSMHSDSTPPPPPQMSSIHIEQKLLPSGRMVLEWQRIVGDPVFHPSHIQHSSWDQINRILGQHECNDGQWFDEDDGWVKDSVTISVPFHSKTPSPGPINFSVDEFYHRSIVAVVKEKILNYQQDNFFHYEPFEVHWHREDHPEPVRV
ncbi:hypothetical protein A0H81_11675 [Grifola frondosa]|uniref:Uncharacterized protein n=1 Tax=Grifola frondosa TaxID=5627 RepID=A0A1C7LUY9_GRIFR|nr:hypothetical protein A0H81_11675 [Grifola frondosa]